MLVAMEAVEPEMMAGIALTELMGDTALPDIEIEGLTLDSRKVRPGYLFAALKGAADDGLRYVPDAVARGARVILVDEGAQLPAGLDATVIARANPRRVMAQMAARFYARQPENLVAVTGTNGKSSVADMWRQLAGLLGHKAASIGTLGVNIGGAAKSFGLTTPDSVTLHETFADLADRGVSHACFEASSHGLEQFRVDGARIKAAAFTNLSRDHLDYHESLEDYLYAKLRLPGEILPPGGTVVVNADNPFSAEVEAIAWARGLEIISVGERGSTISLLMREPLAHGQRLFLRVAGRREFHVDLPLVGAFQANNALVAAGLMMAIGEKPEDVIPLLAKLKGVPGRLEKIGETAQGAPVYVDYAHTPDGLQTVLQSLRPHTENKLHVVFGAGGDRDKGKRPQMGAIAAELADVAYVTDDNPRTEDAAVIRAEILAACPGGREYADRAEAIQAAIAAAGPGDVVLLAGKGHESGQIIGREIIPFNDAEVARAALGKGAAG